MSSCQQYSQKSRLNCGISRFPHGPAFGMTANLRDTGFSKARFFSEQAPIILPGGVSYYLLSGNQRFDLIRLSHQLNDFRQNKFPAEPNFLGLRRTRV